MAKASIQAVARAAGVSVSTVSRTFAKPDLVLPDTRDKVLAAAERLEYRVSRSAAALKSGQTLRVALLASERISTWFNANVFAGLDAVLRPAGYDIAPFPMSSVEERQRFFADLPVRRNADAVIVSSFNIEPDEVERLKNMRVPVIGVNIPASEGFDAGVSIDDHAASRRAAEHLIALGHRHIAFVGGTATRSGMRFSAEARLQGIIDACARHDGVEAVPLMINRSELDVNSSLNAVLSASPELTAVCFQDDELALPVLYRLRGYGRQVPRDLSIIGFDDIDLAAQVGLTTIHQDPFAMGSLAAEKTLAAIADEPIETPFETPDAPLILRDTTAPPPTSPSS
ncbi:LacI family DNA-binding transcriptional regulator [Bifidobacterium eulemuris]|uniref:LacI family DNA-binding transcriptional regulator n=1 Tax=Bifidobacterium eulemuris TaxID=1765219 RepID=A0A261G2I1_9BIFI|nr:LacI family DNA-binding transcriptional regulator [Bifidobacterium eulemuris]OZG65629.1 transcriptional regulator, lacI [Bifidobacterium eulemuris]QOL32399.1 LacI family DNA-binding transcriptional regulator [Bifidobacterium eulemuris]